MSSSKEDPVVGSPAKKCPARRRIRGEWLVVLVVVVAWVEVMVFAFPPLVSFFILLALLLHGRFVPFLVGFALTPMFILAVSGVMDYACGKATLRGMGLPGPGYYNLNRTYRVRPSSGGCQIGGSETWTNFGYNTGVVLAYHVFGPMPGAYDGPYPTKEQAIAAVADGKEVSLRLLVDDVVVLDGRRYELGQGVGSRAVAYSSLRHLVWEPPSDESERQLAKYPARGVLFEGRCLVLRIPHGEDVDSEKSFWGIVLLDAEKGRLIAEYSYVSD